MQLKKILKKLKNNAYVSYCNKEINDKVFLLEAGQGKNINGNMFAIARELCTNPRWRDYKPVFVVSKGNEADAKKRFDFYGYQIDFVIRDSNPYKRYLATAKYIMTDNSFPPYFSKREGQVYVNTWHGTPLKILGVSDLKNAKSLANIQKNFLMCDYALFPNEFTKDVFMKDYMLENIMGGKLMMADYPRNSVFLDKDSSKKLREKLHLANKQLIAYMPTWRGTGRSADIELQKEILENLFIGIDRQLKDDQLFYVNLHFLIGNVLDFTKYKHILPFPEDYETYDFLAICDMLVTDYSSVFFDYAITNRKVILFTYDLDDYMRDRGTYFPMEDLPFPIVKKVPALIKEINKRTNDKEVTSFIEKYCAYSNRNASENVLKQMITGTADNIHIAKAPDNHKELLLVYGGKLKNQKLNMLLHTYVETAQQENANRNVVLCFSGAITKKKAEFLETLSEGIQYYALVNKFEFPLKEKILSALSMRSIFFAKRLRGHSKEVYEKEKQRLFYHLKPKKVVYFSGNPQYMYRILSMFSCSKEAHIQHNNVMGVMARSHAYRIMIAYMKEIYDAVVDHRFDDVRALWDEDEKDTYYNKCLQMGNVLTNFHNGRKGLKISSIGLAVTVLPFSLKSLKVKVAEQVYDVHMHEGLHVGRGMRLTRFSLMIPYTDVRNLEIQNKVNLIFQDSEGYGIKTGMKYNLMNLRKGRNYRGPIHIFEKTETSAYFRQTVNNVLYFTVRKRNQTDARKEQFKLGLAYCLANIIPMKKIILLYEKESSRYEESASVLYEKLIDEGMSNAYFILDKKYPHIDRIDEKYKQNILYKTSFKHYFYFFKSKTFLGSEAMVHAIDLRISNRFAQRKLAKKNINYVFLQHGVMYMVSLDSESRKFFKPKKTTGKYRVVVSSQKEAEHFIDLGGYKPENIYISGLPKYDRNVWSDSANKIVIMPTWRPWEYNHTRYDFSQTKYYQMIERIFRAIPQKDHANVVILPHPLFLDALKDADFELKEYIDYNSKYDDILKEVKVLITDYSSIAYDAFYRGANVIFYWEEKEECLTNYGPTTKLMLNEHTAYGDVCYSTEDLKKVWTKNMSEGQSDKYVDRYQQLVDFHDGKNTERLISFLKKDDLI